MSYQAEFVPLSDPSLTEQYEYANEHDIKCLVIITDTGVSQKGSVKVLLPLLKLLRFSFILFFFLITMLFIQFQ